MSTWVVEEPKWHWTLQQCLSRFQDQGILCDTVLACANGKTIKAHSCVLAAASDRIRNLLDGVQSNDYTLRMDSVTSTTWHYILRFIYDGRVALPLDQVERVKDAAIRFQIMPLINLLNTLEKLRGQIKTVESNVSRKTSTSCQDKGDVIILDDEDDDDDGEVLLVERETNAVSSVTMPTTDGTANVSGSDSDSTELRSSSSQSSRLSKSIDDRTASTLVPRLANTSLLDDLCATVSLENPLVHYSETRVSGGRDKVSSDISGRSIDIDSMGLPMLSKSYSSSPFPSIMQNTSLYTVLRDARCSSNDTNEPFDVSEVVCMDSPASSCTRPEDKATEESCDQSEDVSEEKSLAIPKNCCSSAVAPKTSFACSHVSGIYSQFVVSKPSGMMLPVDGNTKERTDMLVEQALETVANDILPVREPGVYEDQYGPQNSPWEDEIEDEAPLLCISNIVSLSGQITDFSEPDSAFICSNSSLSNLPLTAEADVAANDLRTRALCVDNDSSATAPFISASPPTIMKNPIVNSTESVTATTEVTRVSNCTEVIPQTEVPSSRTALRINLSSSAILSGDVPGLLNGSNACISMQPSSASKLSDAHPALRFRLARSPEAGGKMVSKFLSKQSSRNSENFLLPKDTVPNMHLVSLPCDSQRSTLPQSIVSSLSRGYKQFPVPPTVPVPAVPLSGFVEEFPAPSVVHFPAVPLSGHLEEFPAPSIVHFPAVPLSGHVEEFPAPPAVPFGAVSRVPRPVLELSNSDWVEETYSKPTGIIFPSRKTRAKKTPPLVSPLKNPYTFFAESTTPEQPQVFKKDVGLKRAPKRRKTLALVETSETPTKPSDDATVYTWPGESRQFNGCAKLPTDHDYLHNSPTGKSSVVAAKGKHLLETQELTEPLSVVGPSGNPDLQVSGSSFADETSFVQPDSTVLETRQLPLEGSIYNFTDSDSESNTLPGRPQPSITSTRPIGTFHGSAKDVKRRGRTPLQKLPKQPTPKKTAEQGLLREEDKPKKKRKKSNVLTVHESGGSTSPNDRPSSVQFVGREIRHEWVVEMESRATRWYNGKVLSVVRGNDGERNSQYEVKYEGEDTTYLIDHLFEDYLDGSLAFV